MIGKYNQFIHYYPATDRYVIAEYRNGAYYARLRPAIARATGCHNVYGNLRYIADVTQSYSRRADARRALQNRGDLI